MNIPSRFFTALLLVCVLVLSACGGGSDSQTTDTDTTVDPIRVNAGASFSLDENQSADLLGGSSGGNGAITYAWQSDASVVITHPDTTVTNATVLAPNLTQTTVFTLTLVATDADGSQQSDSIELTVNPVNIAPTAVIQANQIAGYNANQFPVSSQITLNGSSSSDADPQTADAAIVAYNWQQVAGPGLLAGIDSSQSSISLIAPLLDTDQQATFRLTVTDQEQENASTDYTVTLLSQQQTIPELSVSAMRNVFSGELVALSASASSIAPDASPFTASWTQNASGQISDPSAFDTVATSPLVLTDTTVTYQISATDSFRNTVSAQTEGIVYAPLTRLINDTGMTLFANESQLSNQHQNDYPGQDASYGADRQTASGQVIKVGEGEQGFDFTRLDDNGDAVENPSFDFSCVRDNVSGLIWQVKENQDSSQLNYVEQTFTWYLEDENGNFPGELNPNASTCNVQSQSCNTQAYIEAINSQGLCGFFDWRLPSPNEMQSIVHYGKATPPMVDSTFFPYLGGSNATPLWYWTRQSSADGVSNDTARNAWAYDMNTGNDGFLDKSSARYVLLVRAGR